MAPDKPSEQTSKRRRYFLKTTGALTTAGLLAGCSGGGGQNTTTTTDDTGGDDTGGGGDDTTTADDSSGSGGIDIVDRRFNWYTTIVTDTPSKAHWNPYAATGGLRPYYGHIMLGKYNPVKDGFHFNGVKSYEKNGDTITLKLRENHTWHPSGDPVSAQDLRTKFKLEEYVYGGSPWDQIKGYEVKDEKTLDVVLNKSSTNAKLFLNNLFFYWIDTPHSVFGEWLERLENAGSDEERNGIVGELQKFQWKNENVQLSGQWKAPPELRSNSMLFEVRTDEGKPFFGGSEGYPRETNFKELHVQIVPKGQTQFQLALQGQSDYATYLGRRSQFRPAMQDDSLKTNTFPRMISYELNFNYEKHPEYADPAFRKAVAYALDLKRAAEAAMPNNMAPTTLQTATLGTLGPGPYSVGKVNGIDFGGMYSYKYEDIITDIPIDSFTDYGITPKPEKATQVLRDAGYTKDGNWKTPDGKTIEMPILTSSVTDYFRVQVQEWASALSDFGFKAEAVTVPYDKFLNRFNNSDFGLSIHAWSPKNPFGYSGHVEGWQTNSPWAQTGWLAEDPITVEVPEYGKPDGDTIEVNVTEKLDNALNSSGEEQSKYISQLSWAFNQALPMVICGELTMSQAMNNVDWKWPSTDSAEWPYEFYFRAIDRGVPIARQK